MVEAGGIGTEQKMELIQGDGIDTDQDPSGCHIMKNLKKSKAPWCLVCC